MKLLVAERFSMHWCARRYKRYKQLFESDPLAYVAQALMYGALWHDKKLPMIGVTYDAALNLLPPAPIDIAWDSRMARKVASHVDVSSYERVWLVGRNVADAFGMTHLQLLMSEGKFTVVPHPGRLNELNMEAAKDAIRKLLMHSESLSVESGGDSVQPAREAP